MLIGLTGVAQCGKDTAAQALIKVGFRRLSFADPLREMLYALNPIVPGQKVAFPDCEGDPAKRKYAMIECRLQELVDLWGWEGAKLSCKEIRELLQRLGTDAGRKVLGEDIWVNTALPWPPKDDVVVTDVRFDNEAKAIRALGGIVIKLTRPGYGPVNDHVSDAGISPELIDFTRPNDGTIEDLHDTILPFSRPMRIVRNVQTTTSVPQTATERLAA